MNLKLSGSDLKKDVLTNKPKKYPDKLKKLSLSLCTWGLTIAASCFGSSAFAAESLTLKVGPLQHSITVTELEEFADTGKLPDQLSLFSPFMTPQLRETLTNSLSFDPQLAYQVLDRVFESPEGKQLIAQLQHALPGTDPESLQGALLLAAKQTKKINIINLLKAYPSDRVTVDITAILGIALQFNASNLQSQLLSPVLARELDAENDQFRETQFDPTLPGRDSVRKSIFVKKDRQRQRTLMVDIYYTSDSPEQKPLILMSHGFAADRKFLEYLALHLASHGFTVASVEHPGSNIKSLGAAGFNLQELLPASEFIDRPKDISFILDELGKLNQNHHTLKGRFNTQQVAIVGHSFGGYTALALAGGVLDPREVRKFCQNNSLLGRSPADWLQCAAADLPYSNLNFRDPRISQVIAFNPIIGNLFGQSLTKIDTPTLILTGSQDGITPSIDHQLRPFIQLGSSDKYLLAAIGATHMSVTDLRNVNSQVGQSTLVKEVMGENARPVRNIARAVSLAFVHQLTPQAKEYQPFLTSGYVQSFSSQEITLRLATRLPSSLELWLNTLNAGKQKIIAQKSVSERSLFAKLQVSWQETTQFIWQPQQCTVQLDRIFDRMFQSSDSPSSIS